MRKHLINSNSPANMTKADLIREIKDMCRMYEDHMIRVPDPDRSNGLGYFWGNQTKFELPLSTCGDYVGSAVEESNRRYFLENYAVVESDSFGYGANNAYIRGTQFKRMNHVALVSLYEDVCHLSDYPLLDDELMSEIEREWSAETYESCYRSDIRRDLEKALDYNKYPRLSAKLDDLADEDLDRLVWSAMESTNTDWINEDGNSMYLDVDRIMTDLLPAVVAHLRGTK